MKRAGSTPILPALLTALLVCSAIASAVDKSGYDSQVLECPVMDSAVRNWTLEGGSAGLLAMYGGVTSRTISP